MPDAMQSEERSGLWRRVCRILQPHVVVLTAILLTAFALRQRGLDWPRLHPDEHIVSVWIERGLPYKVYASGFFVLVRPVRLAIGTGLRIADWLMTNRIWELVEPPSVDNTLLARRFNVWLGTLSCLLLYLLARNLRLGRGWALLPAALLALSPYAVEHAHYGTTDTAMVFTLILALWLWAKDLNRCQPRWFMPAAFVLGFAAGTKFTLLALLPVFLFYTAARPGPGPLRRRLLHAPLLALAALLLFGAGFAVATPRVFQWSIFTDGLAHEGNRLQHELMQNMGIYAGQPAMRYLARIQDLGRYAQSLGWTWWLLGAAGLPCLALRRFRRYAWLLLAFPALYTYYWIARSPWVRTQEFLNYLPALAILAALPLSVLTGRRRRAGAALAAVVLLCLLPPLALRALRVTSVFDWKDTRRIAERWLRRHEPPGAVFALARYADIKPRGDVLAVHSVSLDGIDALRAGGADFAITAAGPGGRGMIDPITLAMYPQYQAVFNEFREQSQPIYTWSLLPPRSTWTSFNSVDLDLYALQPPPSGPDLDLTLPHPMLTGDEDHKTVFPDDEQIGAVNGSMLDRTPRTIGFSARGGFNTPPRALLYTAERSAGVSLVGFGARHRVSLDPFDLRVVTLDRPPWLPRPGHVEPLRATAKSRKDVQPIPCYFKPAFSDRSIARSALNLGREHRLPAGLAEANTNLPALLRYQLAVRRGRWEIADALAAAADTQAGQLQRVLDAGSPDIRIRGVGLAAMRDFARVRFGEQACILGQPAPGRPAAGQLVLPARLAAGRYTLAFNPARQPQTPFPTGPLTFRIGQSNDESRTLDNGATASAERERVALTFTAGPEEPLILLVTAAGPGTVGLSDVILSWDPLDQLADIHQAFVLDRAEHLAVQGKAEPALSQLNRLSPPLRRQLEIRRRQILFAAALEGTQSNLVNSAALSLLEAAPGHAKALHAVAGPTGIPDLKAIEEIPPCEPLVFQDFVALRRFKYYPELRTAVGVFECLRNQTPRLTATVLYRKHFKWRRKRAHAKPLRAHPALSKGEWVRVVVPLTDQVSAAADPGELALCVEADLEWAPGRLRIDGRKDRIVRLSEIQPAP